MHERAHVEEHVVEGVDGQTSSLISVFQRYDGGVHRVGQITETWATRLDHLLGALWTKTRFTVRLTGLIKVRLSHLRTYSGDVIGCLSQ